MVKAVDDKIAVQILITFKFISLQKGQNKVQVNLSVSCNNDINSIQNQVVRKFITSE